MKEKKFIEVDLPDFLEEVKKIVQQAVHDEMTLMGAIPQKAQKTSRRYLSRKEVCALLGITFPTLHRHINSGLIECVRIGNLMIVYDS